MGFTEESKTLYDGFAVFSKEKLVPVYDEYDEKSRNMLSETWIGGLNDDL